MTMRLPVTLITGANGEVGHGLIVQLAERGHTLLALDIHPLDDDLRPYVHMAIVGDILDDSLLERLQSRYAIHTIFHLAALLSTRSEFTPEAGHRVNVEGTLKLLSLAAEQSRWQGRRVRFIFPSSIAVYGMPSLEVKLSAPPVTEDRYCEPITMYGCNKLYCEHLGRYYARHFRQLADAPEPYLVDFRSLRFPGLISAVTLPSGGTSDYAPEMLHSAAQGKPYVCFVAPEARIPFMVMPDAIRALLMLAEADVTALKQAVYNVTAFSPSAQEIAALTRAAFPDAHITYETGSKRAHIVDSWPAELDDSAARRDWGWYPEYDLERAFRDYLIPAVRARYGIT
ncbi:MAG: NAD-dependent epimerase/dehydratase family protein [Candidatus Flexifilum sp.]